MDEFSRISYWTKEGQAKSLLEATGVKLAIGDDAAIVSGAVRQDEGCSYEMLYTVDTMVEDIHFNTQTMQLDHIGYKALASNLSDIAAMGGIALHALIAISVPGHYTEEHIKQIYHGIYQCANQYEVAIVGGDTTASPHSLVLTITVIGQVEAGTALRRSGAKPGDLIVTTGIAGRSAAGLHLLLHPEFEPQLAAKHVQSLKQAHQMPQPQLEQGRLLRSLGGCHALNDVSDGLASEAVEIAEASGVAFVLDEQLLPVSEGLSQYGSCTKQSLLDWMLYGGEDYILLGTIDPQCYEQVKEQFAQRHMQIYAIGKVEPGKGEVWLERMDSRMAHKQRERIYKRGYNHFT